MKSIKKFSHTLTNILAALIIGITSLSLTALPTHAVSANICNQNVSNEIKKANGCKGDAKGEFQNTITIIINSVISVLGIVAVVFIIVGGINYITSSGDANRTKKAKDTILYAVIGLVVCVLAFAIVNFVIIDLLG